MGAHAPSHRDPLSPAHGAGGWGWGPGTRGCGALLHPLGWFRDPLPPQTTLGDPAPSCQGLEAGRWKVKSDPQVCALGEGVTLIKGQSQGENYSTEMTVLT